MVVAPDSSDVGGRGTATELVSSARAEEIDRSANINATPIIK
jgi:hypothetical protein